MKYTVFVIVFLGMLRLAAQPFGNVAVFDGVNDIIEAPDAFGTDFTDEITIEAWVNPCEITGYRVVGSKFLCTGDNNAFYFSIFNGKLRWSWDDDACANGSNAYQSNASIIQTNQWQHIAVAHDSLGVTLYLNGAPVAASLTTGSAFGPIQISNQPFRIGAYKTGSASYVGYYKGLIDEVRVWDSKRSSADILADYNATLTGSQTDLVGYYKMDITNSGAGINVPNSATTTGTAVDGTTIGTTTTPVFETQNFSVISNVLGGDTVVCSGTGSLVLDATISGATYLWDNGSTAPTRSVTVAGSYSVKINFGCTEYFDTIQVGFSTPPSVNLGNDTVICIGQTVTLNATTTGASYLWQDGSTDSILTVNQTGTYSVTVTKNGCSSTDQIVVTVVGPANVNLGPDKSICQGTTATLDVTNPFSTYLWSTGSTTPVVNVSQNGVYFVEVNHLCGIKRDTVEITVIPLPQVDLGNDTTMCNGASLMLDAFFNGATYLWQDGSSNSNYAVNQAGTFSVTLTKDGCSVSDQLMVGYVTPATVDLGADQSICQGDSVILDATNTSATYLWSNGSTDPTLTTNQTGTYFVEVGHYCGTVKDTVNIIVNQLPVVNLGNDTTLCVGETYLLDASLAGAAYLWQDGTVTSGYTVNQAGTYSVTLTKDGCTASDQLTVSYVTPATVDLGGDQSICQGNSIILDATNPSATYLWSDGSTGPTLTTNQAGTYFVEVSHYCGIVNDTVNITVTPLPTVDLGNDTALCAGQSLLLNATLTGATYLWQDGTNNSSYTVNQAGTYSVTLTKDGCSSTDQIVVGYSNFNVNLGNDSTLCEGEVLLLDVLFPNASYVWQDGSQNSTYQISEPGIYSVTLSENDCSISDEIHIEYEIVNNQIAYNVVPFCGFSEVMFEANPVNNTNNNISNLYWQLDNHEIIGHSGKVKLEKEGDYTMSFSVTSGHCSIDTSLTIVAEMHQIPESYFVVSNETPDIDESISFRNFSKEANDFLWRFGDEMGSTDFEPEHSYTLAGNFKVSLKASNEFCSHESEVIISVRESLLYFVPNAFTPDGNQSNNTFKPIFTSGFDPYNYQLRIYNRWGELVFVSNDSQVGWDGTYNGDDLEGGTYVWQVLFGQTEHSGRIEDKGTLMMLR